MLKNIQCIFKLFYSVEVYSFFFSHFKKKVFYIVQSTSTISLLIYQNLALCRQMKRVTVTIIATYVLPKKGEGNSISTSKICIKILFIPRLKVWNEIWEEFWGLNCYLYFTYWKFINNVFIAFILCMFFSHI
jgi:hypothetical protein